ncbi:MAG: L,D-transpeptidase [Chloroflexota bacterium]|jgi:lipoprotein-anchoring transpeptidase ErfK/SrfK
MGARLILAVLLSLALVTTSLVPAADTAYAQSGRWIEVDVGSGMAYAVEDGQIVHSAAVTVGGPYFPTPRGTFTINRRVANEIMDSSTIGIPNTSPTGYYLTGVLYTQYFVDGVALHYNYWSPDEAFGSAAGSHGCVGLRLSDAEFFWNFADIGTPVIVY